MQIEHFINFDVKKATSTLSSCVSVSTLLVHFHVRAGYSSRLSTHGAIESLTSSISWTLQADDDHYRSSDPGVLYGGGVHQDYESTGAFPQRKSRNP